MSLGTRSLDIEPFLLVHYPLGHSDKDHKAAWKEPLGFRLQGFRPQGIRPRGIRTRSKRKKVEFLSKFLHFKICWCSSLCCYNHNLLTTYPARVNYVRCWSHPFCKLFRACIVVYFTTMHGQTQTWSTKFDRNIRCGQKTVVKSPVTEGTGTLSEKTVRDTSQTSRRWSGNSTFTPLHDWFYNASLRSKRPRKASRLQNIAI